MAHRTDRIYRERLNASFLCCNGDVCYWPYAYGDAVTEEQILEILDLRGLDTILEEHHMSLPFVLGLLNDLGYLDLERYTDSEEEI